MRPSSEDDNVALTKGYNMAFGVLSKALYQALSPDIFDSLLKNTVPKGKESDDAETRKMAVQSLMQAVDTCGLKSLDHQLLKSVLENLYQGLNDYQIDRRGDVGSWVREEAMQSLKTMIQLIVESDNNEL